MRCRVPTDYSTASRSLGLTHARRPQIMSMVLLAPEIQERVLVGELRGSAVTGRSLRRDVREAHWGAERARI